MACTDSIITLAQDANLESNPDGEAKIYYTPPATWPASQGAKALGLMGDVLQISDNTTVKFEMNWSIDGRTWYDSSLPLDGRVAPGLIDGTGHHAHLYTGRPSIELRAPYIRYGIKIKRSDGEKGTVRLTAMIVAMKCVPRLTNTFTLATTRTINPSSTYAQIDTDFATEAYSTLTLNGALSAVPTSGLELALQTTAKRSPASEAMWTTLATTGVATTAPFVFEINGPVLAAFSRVLYTSGASPNNTTLALEGTLK